MYFLLLLLAAGLLQAQPLFMYSTSQSFTSNLTQIVADQTEITRWMNLCAADARCSRFAGLSLGGDNAVQTFNALLTLVPFTQQPPLTFNGIYDTLVGKNVSEVDDELMVLHMVYTFSYYASACSPVEIPLLINGAVTCQTNPRLSGVAPSNNNSLVIFLLALIIILLVVILFSLLYGLNNNRNGIRRVTGQ